MHYYFGPSQQRYQIPVCSMQVIDPNGCVHQYTHRPTRSGVSGLLSTG
jgi:hypothetical protein